MNPNPWRITFDTNPDDCNLKCLMCEEHSPYSSKQIERKACGQPPRRMDISVIERILEELKDCPPREIIPSTMGEPLLYEDFDKILELCRRYRTRLNLTTNGTFPRRGVNEWAREILPLASDVKISFNGVRPETQEDIMRHSRHDTILANIRAFITARDMLAAAGGNYCSVTLQVTFIKKNLEELPDIVRLAAELNVDRVKGHQLWVHFEKMQEQNLRRSAESVARWNRIAEQCHAVAATRLRPSGQSVRLENFDPLVFDADQKVSVHSECPFLGKEAWVNHAGRFDPCCAPDDLRKSLGEFGRLPERSFASIWNSVQYRALVANYWERPLCQQCQMRRATAH